MAQRGPGNQYEAKRYETKSKAKKKDKEISSRRNRGRNLDDAPESSHQRSPSPLRILPTHADVKVLSVAPPSCPSYAQLPRDLIRIIFSYFPSRPILRIFALVCKQWRVCALSCITRIAVRSSVPVVDSLSSITDIDVSSGDRCRCKTLTQLTTLRTVSVVVPECQCACQILRRNCSTITSLSLRFPVLSRQSFDFMFTDLTLPSLTDLSLITAGTTLTEQAVRFVSRHSSRLVSLRLWSKDLSDGPVMPLMVSLELPHLLRIDLSSYRYFNLANAPRLQSAAYYLIRNGRELVNKRSSQDMAPISPPLIDSLFLSVSSFRSTVGDQDSVFELFTQATQLRHLTLRTPPPFARNWLAPTLRGLLSIDVSSDVVISISDLAYLTALTRLTITTSPGLREVNFKKIKFPRLRHFCLYVRKEEPIDSEEPLDDVRSTPQVERPTVAALITILNDLCVACPALRSFQVPLQPPTEPLHIAALLACLFGAEKRGVLHVTLESLETQVLKDLAQKLLYLNLSVARTTDEDWSDDEEEEAERPSYSKFALKHWQLRK